MTAPLLDRIAGAPITWGVDGSPGWGYLMDPDRVLAEMAELGIRATELGPDGYLGDSTEAVLERLDHHNLTLVGGFVPVILYQPEIIDAQLEFFRRSITTLQAGGASIAVLGADSHHAGYDEPIVLDDAERQMLATNLDRAVEIAAGLAMTVATHPHWGMAIADQDDVDRLITDTSSAICLDTGHLSLAGVDMADLVARAGDRVHHVHLKDVNDAMAREVRNGKLPFRQAVIDGLFRPLGSGDVDIAGVVTALESGGFGGWYVLEQDVALEGPPAPGEGPVADARQSLQFLRDLNTRGATA